MNLYEELVYTERAVSSAERTFTFRPRSGIRERALTKALEKVSDPFFARPLELVERDPSLSPGESRLMAQRLALRVGASQRLRQQLEAVRAQDAAADAESKAFAKMSPLQQARTRDGWYRRSLEDRNASILGLLQSERRKVSPLTREAVGRAKAIAASRGLRDPYVVTDADLERAAAGPQLSASYSAHQLTERNRRETLFAKKQIVVGGYPGVRGASRAARLKEFCL